MTTTNLGLSSTTSTAGSAVTFLTWRLLQDGDSASNNIKIDDWVGEASGSISGLSDNVIYSTDAADDGAGNYTATVTDLAYDTNTIINIKLDVTNTGTATLNINTLGTKTLNKLDANGSVINLSAGDLVADRYYFFVYDGTQWMWVSPTSGDQINIPSAAINEIIIASGSGIKGSGILITDIPASSGSYIVMELNPILDNEWKLSDGTNTLVTQTASASSVKIDVTGAVLEADYDENTVLAATSGSTPISLTVAEQTLIGRITAGNIDALTAAEVRTLINVEDNADVTDAANVNTSGAVMESDYDAQTILAATSGSTPAAVTVAEQEIVGRKTGGNVTALTATEVRTLINVEDNADVTDAANVNTAGAVMESDYDANTLLAATSGSTPISLTVAEQTLIGRITAGDIDALTATEVRTLINVADGATADAKASGSEVDTGTDNDKFLTALAVKESHNVPSVVPGTAEYVLTSDGTDWISAASTGGHTIQDSGSALTQEDTLNFTGAGITATEDASGSKTQVEVDWNQSSTEILTDTTVTIPAGVGSVVVGAFEVTGTLILEGTMVIL